MSAQQVKPPESFSLFRHVRNGTTGKGVPEVSNLGGITLYIEVHQATNRIEFSFAIAGATENFNKKIAKNISFGRFGSGQKICGAYNRSASLVENCIRVLTSYVAGVDTLPQEEITIKSSQAVAALTRLRTYATNLPRGITPTKVEK